VKYLGVRETSNLWGIKYTREPVDNLVSEAKRILSTSTDRTLPLLKLEVAEDGITVGPKPQNLNPNFPAGRFPIESISYGVQDLVYTRVFAMIVVKPESSTKKEESSKKLSELSKVGNGKGGALPYRCHVFVTDTRETAKNLTYALAAAFQKFSHKVSAGKVKVGNSRQVALDLRSGDDEDRTELDSSEAWQTRTEDPHANFILHFPTTTMENEKPESWSCEFEKEGNPGFYLQKWFLLFHTFTNSV